MTQPVFDNTPTAAESSTESLKQLGRRLIEQTDRESYAELLVWLHTLPPGDEMVKLARLLAFLTLIGNDLPVALERSAATISGLVQTNERYHRALHDRLSKLPAEIGAGIDLQAFADTMGESFRQQFAETGIEKTADYLQDLAPDLKGSVDAIGGLARSMAEKEPSIRRSFDTAAARLNDAVIRAEQASAMQTGEIQHKRSTAVVWCGIAIMALGLYAGIYFEKRSTTDAIASLQGQVEQVQQSIQALKVAPQPDKTKRH